MLFNRTGRKLNMLKQLIIVIYFLSSSLISPQQGRAVSSDNDKVVVIIIDGARYSETFGDSTHTYVPEMWKLASEGSMINSFYNDSVTITSKAIPALWSGSWTNVRDTNYLGNNTKYSLKPSIFEYYRKQKNMPAEQCIYVIKDIQSLWLQSFDQSYGPDYWPLNHSSGVTDKDVAEQAKWVMDTYNPQFLWIYLADVDSRGHDGNWGNYTNAIQIADTIVSSIWEKIQYDRFYANTTTLFVTNDHGRHNDENGGFQGHGDDCDGCRHIQLLALGPNIKKNFISNQYRRIPDMSVTIADIFELDPEEATGEVMSELFLTTEIEYPNFTVNSFSLEQNYPNPFNPETTIEYSLPVNISQRIVESRQKSISQSNNHSIRQSSIGLFSVQLKVFDVLGREVATLVNEQKPPGTYRVNFDGSNLPSGIYIYRILTGSYSESRKMTLLN